MAQVSITIDGKTYRMACEDGQEEHLRTLGAKMDDTIQTLREGFGEVGEMRLAIMAGIVMADELAEADRKVAGLEAEVASLKESRSALMERYQRAEDTLARALGEITERVQRVSKKLRADQTTVHLDKPAAE